MDASERDKLVQTVKEGRLPSLGIHTSTNGLNGLINGRNTEMPTQMLARQFCALDKSDQREILNLIEFRRMMKERD